MNHLEWYIDPSGIESKHILNTHTVLVSSYQTDNRVIVQRIETLEYYIDPEKKMFISGGLMNAVMCFATVRNCRESVEEGSRKA